MTIFLFVLIVLLVVVSAYQASYLHQQNNDIFLLKAQVKRLQEQMIRSRQTREGEKCTK
jgi:predicted RND superfamily exporter protein